MGKREQASAAYNKQASAFQQRKTARLVAQSVQKVAVSALQDEEAFDADLHSICSVGSTVQQRLESEIAPVLKQVLQFVDEAQKAKPAPATTAAAVVTTAAPVQTVAATTAPPAPTTALAAVAVA